MFVCVFVPESCRLLVVTKLSHSAHLTLAKENRGEWLWLLVHDFPVWLVPLVSSYTSCSHVHPFKVHKQPRSICWDLELDQSVHLKIDWLVYQQQNAPLNDVHEVSVQLLQGRRDSNLSKISWFLHHDWFPMRLTMAFCISPAIDSLTFQGEDSKSLSCHWQLGINSCVAADFIVRLLWLFFSSTNATSVAWCHSDLFHKRGTITMLKFSWPCHTHIFKMRQNGVGWHGVHRIQLFDSVCLGVAGIMCHVYTCLQNSDHLRRSHKDLIVSNGDGLPSLPRQWKICWF